MITIFNRRQLAVTYALEEKIHICRVLAEQNIESATGSFGENSILHSTSQSRANAVTAPLVGEPLAEDSFFAIIAYGSKTIICRKAKKKSSQLGGLFARGIYCIFFWHSGQTPSSTRFI